MRAKEMFARENRSYRPPTPGISSLFFCSALGKGKRHPSRSPGRALFLLRMEEGGGNLRRRWGYRGRAYHTISPPICCSENGKGAQKRRGRENIQKRLFDRPHL